MKCPRCGHENREEAGFCVECAQPLEAEPLCPECGHTNPIGSKFCEQCAHSLAEPTAEKPPQPPPAPTSFAGGRYQVKKFLGEGGKKKVYLAHDTLLDRDVAFALLKVEKLDDTAERASNEKLRQWDGLVITRTSSPSLTSGSTKGSPISFFPSCLGAMWRA